MGTVLAILGAIGQLRSLFGSSSDDSPNIVSPVYRVPGKWDEFNVMSDFGVRRNRF